jgi:pyruvate,orthophosphate dikinase
MGKPCITGCQGLMIDEQAKNLRADSLMLTLNDAISIDGSSGEVFAGTIEIIEPERTLAGFEGESEIVRYYSTYSEWKERLSPGSNACAEP